MIIMGGQEKICFYYFLAFEKKAALIEVAV